MPPNGLPGVERGRREREAAERERADEQQDAARGFERRRGHQHGHERRRGDGRREVDARPGHENPRRGLRSHRLLAEELREVVVPLEERRPLAVLEPRLHLLDDGLQQRAPRRAGPRPAAPRGRPRRARQRCLMSHRTSEPDEQQHAEHEHVGEVRVEAAGLQHLQAFRHAQDAAQQRTVDVPLEGRLDRPPGSGPPAGSRARPPPASPPGASAGTPPGRSSSAAWKRRSPNTRCARTARRRIPTSAPAARRARDRAVSGARERRQPAEQRRADHRRRDVIERAGAATPCPSADPRHVRRRLQIRAATPARRRARAARPRETIRAPTAQRGQQRLRHEHHRRRLVRVGRAGSLRGSARNVMPNAFTKHAAASALVSASIAPLSGKFSRTRPGVDAKPSSSA